MNCNLKESYRLQTNENLYNIIWENISYRDIINNTTIFTEEDIGFVKKEYLPYIISATIENTGNTRFYFFTDVSSVVEKYINPNCGEAIIPITEELIKKYEVTAEQYLEDCSKRIALYLIVLKHLSKNDCKKDALP